MVTSGVNATNIGHSQSFMKSMRTMLETIGEKQTLALKIVLDEAYKLMERGKVREAQISSMVRGS